MAPYNNKVYEEELNQYTRKLRHHMQRVEDGYEGYGQFNALPVKWFNIEHRSLFHHDPYGRGIVLPNRLRRFTTISISTHNEYSFLDQFWDIQEQEFNTEGVCAMHAGQVVPVPNDCVIPQTETFDLVYSGMYQSPNRRTPIQRNQHMINTCETGGVVLVVVSTPQSNQCKVLGFYQGDGYDTNGPRDRGHPHRFHLRRL